jgi:hypothetical protein
MHSSETIATMALQTWEQGILIAAVLLTLAWSCMVVWLFLDPRLWRDPPHYEHIFGDQDGRRRACNAFDECGLALLALSLLWYVYG